MFACSRGNPLRWATLMILTSGLSDILINLVSIMNGRVSFVKCTRKLFVRAVGIIAELTLRVTDLYYNRNRYIFLMDFLKMNVGRIFIWQ